MPRVASGLERLLERPEPLRGLRVGLIVNPASITHDFVHASVALHGRRGVKLRALFGPEHGIAADAQDLIEVGHSRDRATGLLNRIDKTGDDYHLDQLSAYLTQVKGQFPQKTDATLLLEPDISYEVVVAVMDSMREVEHTSESDGQFVRSDLFPEISLGDAPVRN